MSPEPSLAFLAYAGRQQMHSDLFVKTACCLIIPIGFLIDMRPPLMVGCIPSRAIPMTSPKGESAGERRFRLVVEAAPNAMVMVDPAGKIVMVNTQAERVFGYARTELVGQPVEMLVPERFRSHHPELRTSFFTDPRPRPMGAGRDLYGLKKDGSEFPVEIGLNPIETDEGTMGLSAIVDITARKRDALHLHRSVQQ